MGQDIRGKAKTLETMKFLVASTRLIPSCRSLSSTATWSQKAAILDESIQYEGPTMERTKQIRKENLNPAMSTYYKSPLLIHKGSMQWLWDHEGRKYLDMFGGIVTVSVGHCHPKVNEALEQQLKTLWHTTNIYLHPKVHEYAERLVATLPDPLKVVYFVNSGSEANDLAMFMSRLHTGNNDILSFRHAYHGMSPYTMGLTAHSTWKFPVATGAGVHHVMLPDTYRGLWGGPGHRDCPVRPNGVNLPTEAESRLVEDLYLEQLEEGCQEVCRDVGTYLLDKLVDLVDSTRIVGDVRGKGLMIGIEMVADKTSKRPLPADKMMDLWEMTKEGGVLLGKGGFYGNVFRIKPPMCITKQDADFTVEVLEHAVRAIEAQM